MIVRPYFADLANAYDNIFQSKISYKGFQYRVGLIV